MTPSADLGPSQDPGYLGSLTTQQPPLTLVRHVALALVTSPALLWLVVPVLDLEASGTPPWGLLLVTLMVAGALVAAWLVPQMVEPLEPGTGVDAAEGVAVATFRRQVLLQIAAAEAPVVAGFLLAWVADSLLLWCAAFLLGWPLVLICLPTTTTVERMRERLEAKGADSHIWAALLRAPGAPR